MGWLTLKKLTLLRACRYYTPHSNYHVTMSWNGDYPDFAAEVIYDHSDEPSLGTVTYLPIMEMYPIGDANSDGEVNVQDIQAIISYMLDGTGINFDSADANSDGYVNILDIVLIVNIIENF